MSQLKVNSIVPKDGLQTGSVGGGIIQHVQTVFEDDHIVSSSYSDINGFTATIKPGSLNSKILITSQCGLMNNNPGGMVYMKLLRNGGEISELTPSSNSSSYSNEFNSTATFYESGTNQLLPWFFVYLDTPGLSLDNNGNIPTVTYKWQWKTNIVSGSTQTGAWINNRYTASSGLANNGDMRRKGTMLLQEVTG